MKDARAEIEQIDAGLKSRTQALAERGYDAEQVDAEIAADKAREKSLGLSFSSTATAPAANDGAAANDAATENAETDGAAPAND
jgi:capsid protein